MARDKIIITAGYGNLGLKLTNHLVKYYDIIIMEHPGIAASCSFVWFSNALIIRNSLLLDSPIGRFGIILMYTL